MINKPGKKDKYIIFEGPSEEKFLKHFENLFGSNYNLKLINAKGKDKILYEYRKIKKKNPYSDVCLMYDLDSITKANDIIKAYKNKGLPLSKTNIYFINPQFELLLILIKEKRTPTNKYNVHIKRLYGIQNYEKTDKQLTQIMKQITKDELEKLIINIKQFLSKDDKCVCSSNYDILFEDVFINKKDSVLK